MEKKLPPGIDRAILESKLKAYNQYYEGNSGQLKWKERNGKLILEGVLRIHWGVKNLIHLKENEDQRHHVQLRKRYSYREPPSTRRSRKSENGMLQNPEHSNGDLQSEKHTTSPTREHLQDPAPLETLTDSDTSNMPSSGIPDAIGSPLTGSPSSPPMEEAREGGESNAIDNSEAVIENKSNVNDNGDEETHLDTRKDISTNGGSTNEGTLLVTEESELNKLNSENLQSAPLKYDTINDPEDFDSCGKSGLKMDSNVTTSTADMQLSDDEDEITYRRERIDLSRVQIRKLASSRSKTKLRRRCSINGHYYIRETKTFTPPHGSATNVWVTSMVNTSEVINLLLDKFCVENSPEDFALFVVRENGEIRRIKEEECPLLARVLLGPHEEVVKVFIMDKNQTDEISNEVAQYLNFQEPELNAILHKFYEEENREVKKLKLKYAELRRRIQAKLSIMDESRKLN